MFGGWRCLAKANFGLEWNSKTTICLPTNFGYTKVASLKILKAKLTYRWTGFPFFISKAGQCCSGRKKRCSKERRGKDKVLLWQVNVTPGCSKQCNDTWDLGVVPGDSRKKIRQLLQIGDFGRWCEENIILGKFASFFRVDCTLALIVLQDWLHIFLINITFFRNICSAFPNYESCIFQQLLKD